MPVRAKLPDGRTITVPDDTSPDELDALVNADAGESTPAEHPHARVARLVKENLPAIGGTIGGLLGAVGGPVVAAGTAALGGAGGRLAQRALAGDVQNVGEMATDAAESGAIQGAVEGAGGGAGKVLGAVGSRLYNGLLKPSKALTDQFPDVVSTLMKIKAPISGKGIGMAERALDESSQEATRILERAAPTADPIHAYEIIPEFKGTRATLKNREAIGQPSQLSDVSDRAARLTESSGANGFDLLRAQELKRTAQDAAHAGRRQAERGTVKEVSPETMLDSDVARGFRKQIEQRAPDVGPVNQQTQRLMGGKSALEDAVGRESKTLHIGGAKDFLAAGIGGAGYAAGADKEQAATLGLLVRLLATPSTGSRAAIQALRAGKIAPAALPALLRILSPSHEAP